MMVKEAMKGSDKLKEIIIHMLQYSLFAVIMVMFMTAHLTYSTIFLFKANEQARGYKVLDPKAAIRNWTYWVIALVMDIAGMILFFAVRG
jgi:hypothetical protein